MLELPHLTCKFINTVERNFILRQQIITMSQNIMNSDSVLRTRLEKIETLKYNYVASY